MDILYRYLGLAAGISQNMSRYSINFVPSNFLLMAGCAALILGAPTVAGTLSWLLALPLAVMAAGVLAVLGWLAWNRNVVFRPRRGGAAHEVRRELDTWYRPPANSSPDAIDLHVSGEFDSEGGGRKFYLELPAGYEHLVSDERRFECQINDSSAFFGVTTSSRSGLWRLSVLPGSGENFEPGTLYFGGGARPALRLNGKTVLSFADGAQRTRFAKLWREQS